MNFIKRLLFKILGIRRYLLVVSRMFFVFYNIKLIKGNKLFDCHYFVKKLIREGNVVIDVGANLGYYSVIFSKLVGSGGKVYCVEPVNLYRQILEKNTKQFSNVEILPYALGDDDNKQIKMGAPSKSNYFSHGRTHVLKNEDECSIVFDATVMRPESLFSHLTQLHYIKCDIEGYEGVAIPLFEKVIDNFHPIVQVEIASDNFDKLSNFFREKGYRKFYLKGERLIEFFKKTDEHFGDIFFLPSDNIDSFKHLMQ